MSFGHFPRVFSARSPSPIPSRDISQRAERVRDHWVCAGFPVAPPLWMDVPSAEAPAFAGMMTKERGWVGGNDGVG